MHDLENELKAFEGEEHDESHKQKAIDALKRMESWDVFRDPHEVIFFTLLSVHILTVRCWLFSFASQRCSLIFIIQCYILFLYTKQGIQNYTVARDSFLAHLGSTLWGSMRHIIAPSIADGAYHYYEKVSFQLFFITQEVYMDNPISCYKFCFQYINYQHWPLMQKLRNIRQLPLDLAAVKDSLLTLIVPTQKVMFSQTLYASFSFLLNVYYYLCQVKVLNAQLCNFLSVYKFHI